MSWGFQSEHIDVFDLGIHMMCAIPFSLDHATILYEQFKGDVMFSFRMLEHEFYLLEIANGVESFMLEDLGNSEVYDELCLFEQNAYFSKSLCNINFTCSKKEFIQKKWCWFLSCQYNSLFRRGSYFCQPVNGFV